VAEVCDTRFVTRIWPTETCFVFISDMEGLIPFFFLFAEAEKARDALNGRFFGGRLVKAELYDQELFNMSDFSG